MPMADIELCLQEIEKRIMDRRKSWDSLKKHLAEKVMSLPSLFLMRNQENGQ